jgi:uncharacterized protein with beta-barrel porin domain
MRVSPGRLGLSLLASSSVAALLIGGGAPAAFAACSINEVGTTVGAITTSGPNSCINIQNSTVNGDVTNGHLINAYPDTVGPPTMTGITVNNSTINGSIANSGTIEGPLYGIVVGARPSSSTVANGAAVSGGISNSGTISSGYTGVVVSSISSFGGGISNSGTISEYFSGGAGVYVNDVSTFSGGISNSKLVEASVVGIYVSGVGAFTGGISNSGTIGNSLTSVSADGIGLYGDGTFANGITNSAAISVGHTGILVQDVINFSGGISNGGTISANAYGGIALYADGTFAGGITNSGTIAGGRSGINVYRVATFTGGITNSGAGTIAGAWGILVYGGGSFSGNIDNRGTVTGFYSVTNANGGSGISVSATSHFTGSISNSGSITATFHGIGITAVRQFGTSGGGGVTNTGTISITGFYNEPLAAVYVLNVSTFSGNVSNSGIIAGPTGIGVGSSVTFSSGSAIVNSGTITGSVAAIDVSSATSPVTIDQTAGTMSGAIKLSAHADVLNISGGTINGNIVGAGTSDTVNFQLGAGTIYTDNNAFTGVNQVNIESGTVVLNGANSATNVDVYGTLAGTGSIDPTALTIHSGATFAPGSGTPGSSMAITGNLVLQSGATYQVYVNPSTSSFASASGTASLGGTVNASFASGNYLTRQYLILQSAGLGGTSFTSLSTTNLPKDATAVLDYTADDVYLDLTASLPAGNFNVNQQNVANALNGYFNSGGALPPNFITLFDLSGPALANALTKLDGEASTDADKGAFQLMTDFLDLMLDPTAGGGGGMSGGGASGFAPEQDASLPPDVALAYAKALNLPVKAPRSQASQTFDQRWSAWGSGFGGTSFTNGNAAIGSNNVTASDYGFAAGMDYRATPGFTYGFALAGGGTNWNLAQGLGSGRSDAFQAGVYAKTHWGPLYFSGALAFANHWFTTDRIAMSDQLRATFTGQSYAARGEMGYRYAVPVTGAIIGVTPYAALQAQDFHTPSYSETDLTGGGFALSYNAMNATDTRSELGARFDNLQIVDGMPLVLRGRLAWAHDWFTDATALNAVFQTLPGTSFTVNGAAPPKNSALTTAAAELHISANWTAIAKFDGDFGAGSQTYGGTGTLRYSW